MIKSNYVNCSIKMSFFDEETVNFAADKYKKCTPKSIPECIVLRYYSSTMPACSAAS